MYSSPFLLKSFKSFPSIVYGRPALKKSTTRKDFSASYWLALGWRRFWRTHQRSSIRQSGPGHPTHCQRLAAHGQDDDDVAEWFGFDMRKVASFEDRQELLPGVGFFHWCTNLAILNHPILWFILRLKKFYCPRVFVWMFAGGVDGQVHMVNTLSACLGSILPGMIPIHLWPGWQESQGLRRFQKWELPWNHLLFETLRTLRSWCTTCAQMMCRDIQLMKRQLRLSWWWEVWGEVCWLVRLWLCLKMAMLMQTNDKPNEVLKCQKLKRCVSIPAPNDRIGFVLLLVIDACIYIYL